ncbi:MAG: trehalose-6-phosphate synthase [Vicinamibacterales bacterium]
MTGLLALVLTAAAMIWLRYLGPGGAAASAGTILALGFAVIGAWVTGDLLRRFQLPRLTGYLLFGVLVGPYLGNIITEAMTGQLRALTGAATTLIAFIAGLALNFERLGRGVRSIAVVTGVTIALASVTLAAVVWLAWGWLPIQPDASGLPKLAMIAILVFILVSFSPTMTAAVIADTGARGRLSDMVVAIVVLADLVILVLFSTSVQLTRLVLAPGSSALLDAVGRFVWQIGGALAFGAMTGACFALYVRYVGREITLVLLGVCVLLSQMGSSQEFEPLLAAVAAGLVVENLSVAQGETLRAAVQRGAPPILIVFFVFIGASLRFDTLLALGPVTLGLAAVRLVALRSGLFAGLRLAGVQDHVARLAWTGLISQAGVTLGFASIVAAEFPGWGQRVQTLVVALIAVHELAGPLLLRLGLVRSGTLEADAPRPMMVVSNREPFLHNRRPDGQITWSAATGGVAVALDALMRERGGVWIAHGAGSADRDVVDEKDKVAVPPDGPAYTLRRLWIDESTFTAYYGGFANEGLWPLCHVVDVRPKFRSDDWAAYQEVNAGFAAAIAAELGGTNTPVFIQDYHLAVVAPALRALQPHVRTALFWHIPWPYPDRLRICPWRQEILSGLLANDLLAFQLERDRRNFLMAAEEELDARVEHESSRVWFGGRYSTVVSVPIGVDYDRIQTMAADQALPDEQHRLSTLLALRADVIGIGVDRLDYTKGIPERLAALDLFLQRRPTLRGRLTFVQIGVPSRSELENYAAIESEINHRVAEINARHAVPRGAPAVCYYTIPLSTYSLVALYRLAHFCIVSSLHDGMNLVAKEFVAARDDEEGVLVLSMLAGAAQELGDALIINPYDVEGFADALARAVDMPAPERRARMRAMRQIVAGRNVFGWASDILEGLENIWTKPLHYSVRGWEDMNV